MRLIDDDRNDIVINRNFDPENDFYDRESDENFEEIEMTVEDEDESMQSLEEESSDAIEGRNHRRGRQRNVDVVYEDRSRNTGRRSRRNQEE